MKKIKPKLLIFIQKISKSKKKIKGNTILSNSVLDSLNMLDLIDKIENEFNIKLEGADLDYKNFSTINKIEELIKKKC